MECSSDQAYANSIGPTFQFRAKRETRSSASEQFLTLSGKTFIERNSLGWSAGLGANKSNWTSQP